MSGNSLCSQCKRHFVRSLSGSMTFKGGEFWDTKYSAGYRVMKFEENGNFELQQYERPNMYHSNTREEKITGTWKLPDDIKEHTDKIEVKLIQLVSEVEGTVVFKNTAKPTYIKFPNEDGITKTNHQRLGDTTWIDLEKKKRVTLLARFESNYSSLEFKADGTAQKRTVSAGALGGCSSTYSGTWSIEEDTQTIKVTYTQDDDSEIGVKEINEVKRYHLPDKYDRVINTSETNPEKFLYVCTV
jgi:hypothetical protein